MGGFNGRTSSNQAILIRNHSNPNPLWLDEDLSLARRYNRSSKDLGENLFGSELVKLCSACSVPDPPIDEEDATMALTIWATGPI